MLLSADSGMLLSADSGMLLSSGSGMLLLEGSVKLLSSGSGMLHSEASGMLLHVNAQPRSAYAARACHPIAGGVFPLSWVRDGLSNVREDCPNARRAPRRIQSRAGAAAPKQSKFGVCRRETEQSRGVPPRNPPTISHCAEPAPNNSVPP